MSILNNYRLIYLQNLEYQSTQIGFDFQEKIKKKSQIWITKVNSSPSIPVNSKLQVSQAGRESIFS